MFEKLTISKSIKKDVYKYEIYNDIKAHSTHKNEIYCVTYDCPCLKIKNKKTDIVLPKRLLISSMSKERTR